MLRLVFFDVLRAFSQPKQTRTQVVAGSKNDGTIEKEEGDGRCHRLS